MYVYPGSDVCYSWEEGKEGGGASRLSNQNSSPDPE